MAKQVEWAKYDLYCVGLILVRVLFSPLWCGEFFDEFAGRIRHVSAAGKTVLLMPIEAGSLIFFPARYIPRGQLRSRLLAQEVDHGR
jgi:hypothetical protein